MNIAKAHTITPNNATPSIRAAITIIFERIVPAASG